MHKSSSQSLAPTRTPRRRKKMRLEDIAEAAEVSIATVSLAMANDPQIRPATCRRIQVLAERMGYRRRTAVQRNETIPQRPLRICFADRSNQIGDALHSAVLTKLGLLAGEDEMSTEILALDPRDNDQTWCDRILARASNCDGLLLCGVATPLVVDALVERGIAAVILGPIESSAIRLGTTSVTMIMFDDCRVGRFATSWLIERGHQRVGFVCEQTCPGLGHATQLDGYRLAHLHHGMEICEELTCVTGVEYSGAAPAVQRWATLSDPPTAFVVPDARIASSLVREMQLAGRPLDDHAMVVVCSDMDTARRYEITRFPLLIHDLDRMVAVAVERLTHLCRDATIRSAPMTMIAPTGSYGFPGN